jgi:hypothetical protein
LKLFLEFVYAVAEVLDRLADLLLLRLLFFFLSLSLPNN